jgi:hypothetical protein
MRKRTSTGNLEAAAVILEADGKFFSILSGTLFPIAVDSGRKEQCLIVVAFTYA